MAWKAHSEREVGSLRLLVGLERGKDWLQGDSLQSSSLSIILESPKGEAYASLRK